MDLPQLESLDAEQAICSSELKALHQFMGSVQKAYASQDLDVADASAAPKRIQLEEESDGDDGPDEKPGPASKALKMTVMTIEKMQHGDFHTVRELTVRGCVQKIGGLSQTKPKSTMTIKQFDSQINVRAEEVNGGWRKASEGDVVEIRGVFLATAADKRQGPHDLKYYAQSTIQKTSSDIAKDMQLRQFSQKTKTEHLQTPKSIIPKLPKIQSVKHNK